MALNEEETIGNIFILIMAGHELATHPDTQQKVQTEIDSIWASKHPGEDLSWRLSQDEDYHGSDVGGTPAFPCRGSHTKGHQRTTNVEDGGL
jgi:hypothetical protein